MFVCYLRSASQAGHNFSISLALSHVLGQVIPLFLEIDAETLLSCYFNHGGFLSQEELDVNQESPL